jgi:hypothetical protein
MIFLALDFLIEERGGWVRRLSKNRKRLLEWRKMRLRPMLDKLRRKNGGYARFSTVESYQLEIEQEVHAFTFPSHSHAALTVDALLPTTVGRGDFEAR